MKCHRCQFFNPEDGKFCGGCGIHLVAVCSTCHFSNPAKFRFCGECGKALDEHGEPTAVRDLDGERRHVSVLFTDLTGYTAICERLDPEEVKEIISLIFGKIAQIVSKYEGHIEKFLGDAALILFGVPRSHEDDAVRAIKAAMEIHDAVISLSLHTGNKGSQFLSMHSGICTGLVVTGGADVEKGVYGVTGDTVNMAARLSDLGKPGEILVGPHTYRQAEGHFYFEPREPIAVEGKTEAFRIYKVRSKRDQPIKIHRLTGMRAELIGRKAEMAILTGAVEKLNKGIGSVIGICGDAGTGKSRLLEEFKASLDTNDIQWCEGHAYAYTQNIPYYPMTDLLVRVSRIQEGDHPQTIREKIESTTVDLVGNRRDVISFVGSLLSLQYPEMEGVSPDSWKHGLQNSIGEFLSGLVRRAPTIICLEDLHWGDPSFLDLLRFVIQDALKDAMILCVYRPPFSLFPGHRLGIPGDRFREIQLQDLSPSEAEGMMESLLRTEHIPPELRYFVQEKVEGNPFYLEEVINSLIEMGTLARNERGWKLTRPLGETNISPTVHGVIEARLDRLEKESQRILQEASVIGRIFFYEILRKVTDFENHIDTSLGGLERLDLIRTRSIQPHLEFMFKHALTQEAVYNGLLKKDRETLHRRIGLVMEGLFKDRLPELYESLAFHFTQGADLEKSVEYLVKSGEKSLSRCALEESHKNFHQAFERLANSPVADEKRAEYLIDLINKWAPVFFWRGAYIDMVDLLKTHEKLAESLGDNAKAGMLFAWMGLALQAREKLDEAHRYLRKALQIGEIVGDERVVGYACAWLAPTCAEMGLIDDSEVYTERAQDISRRHKGDPMLLTVTLRAAGYASYIRGEAGKTETFGKVLLDQGRRHSDIRSTTMGYFYVGQARQLSGDFPSAIESYQETIRISVEPLFSNIARLVLGMCFIQVGRLQDAETILEEVLKFSKISGTEIIGSGARGLKSVLLLAKGDLGRGLNLMEEALETFRANGSRFRIAMALTMIGNVYLQIVLKGGRKGVSFLMRNAGFLVRNFLYAEKKAEDYFCRGIEVAREIGTNNILAQANLGMGLLSMERNEISKAEGYLSEAVDLFRRCEADVYLKKAEAALASCQERSSHRNDRPTGRLNEKRVMPI